MSLDWLSLRKETTAGEASSKDLSTAVNLTGKVLTRKGLVTTVSV